MIADRLVLRPRTVFASADLALAFVRANAAQLWPAMLLAAALPAAIFALAGSMPADDGMVWLGWFAVLRLSSLPLTLACADLALHPATSLAKNLRICAQRLGAYVLATVGDAVLRLMTAGLTAVLFQFAAEVVLLERGNFGAASARTRALITAHPVLWVAAPLLAVFLPAWGALGGEVALHALLRLAGFSSAGWSAFSPHLTWAAIAGATVGEIGWVVLRFLLYIDCRTRGDGWDLQVQCQAMAERRNSRLRTAA